MVVDLALLFSLVRVLDLPVVAGDAGAVFVASILSWLLHRSTTFALDPEVRWVRMPGAFALVATIAGVVDVVVTSALAAGAPLLPSKLVGVGVAGVVRLVAYRGVLATDTRRSLGARRDPVPAHGGRRLTVVVPAKDEAGRIAATVTRLREELADLDLEVLVVDDGSTDDTAIVAEHAGARVLRHDVNRGKGAAVRSGVLAADGRTVAFLDADLAYPPAQVRPLLAAIEEGWDVAVGDRFHPASVVEGRTRVRFVAGRLFNLLTVTVLLGQYRDTQCGCKAFRSDVARSLFERARLDGFAFDVEVLHLVERDRLSLLEVPVTLTETGGSSVRLVRATFEMLRDLLRVRRWSAEGAYDRPAA
jgi:dolichyl-phosphate beta-glucosyltransferase